MRRSFQIPNSEFQIPNSKGPTGSDPRRAFSFSTSLRRLTEAGPVQRKVNSTAITTMTSTGFP
jgi:hypothetical protein